MNPDEFLERTPRKPGSIPEEKKTARKRIKASQSQEKRVAARLGGKVQARSGAGSAPVSGRRAGSRPSDRPVYADRLQTGQKGDVVSPLLLTECKMTEKASISIRQDHLIKISLEAARVRKAPSMVYSFPVMPGGVDNDWALVPLEWLTEMMAKAGLEGLPVGDAPG